MKSKLLRLSLLSMLAMLFGGAPAVEAGVIYSWTPGEETGGKAVASDGQSVGYANAEYTTIRLNGAKDFSGAVVTITLDEPLEAGDQIAITAYRNKDAADKVSGALLKFDDGSTLTTATSGGLEFVNIHSAVIGTDEYGTEPNTIVLDVTANAGAGSSTITMTRAETATNLFITKIEITGEREEIDADAVVIPSASLDNSKATLTGDRANIASDGHIDWMQPGNTATFKVYNTKEQAYNISYKVGTPNDGISIQWTLKDAAGETVYDYTQAVTKTGNWDATDPQSVSQPTPVLAKGYYTLVLTFQAQSGSTTANVNNIAIVGDDGEVVAPTTTTVTFDIANTGAEGDAPDAQTVEAGTRVVIPQNFTVYKEGYTLTAWTDGQNDYKVGDAVVAKGETMNLTPVFTKNAANLGDQKEPVTVKFDFQRQNGAPTRQWEGKSGLIWVTQATVNGQTIDVKADLSTSPGKFANANWTDWCQLNGGTTFTIPSAKGAVVTIESYSATTTTTIDGQTDYTASGNTVTYTIQNTADNIDIVIGDGSYFRYIQVVLPKVEKQLAGMTFEEVEGTISWKVGNEANGTPTAEIEDAVQSALWATGSNLKIGTSTYFESTMVNYQPTTSNAGNVEGVMIEYRVKMAPGLTFQATSVSYDCVKVGTDGATYSWGYAVDDVASTITDVDASTTLRNNGANSSTASLNHTLDLDFANAGNVFSLRFYISKTANNKNICIGNVKINGVVNGTIEDVVTYTFAAAASPEEGGSVNVYPSGSEFEAGTELTLTATENFGYDFVNWTDANGDVVSEDAKFVYTVEADAVLTANFIQVNTYELALTVDGTNDYMVKVSPAPTVVDGKWMYEDGTAVQLQADQYEGLVTFTNWSDGETNSSKIVSMTDNVELTAFYAEADIIAGWDFYVSGGSGRKADFAAQDNDTDALNLVNTETGETSGWLDKSTEAAGGYESFAGAATNWRTGSQNGDVGHWHWQTKVNAEAFTDINVQFQMLYNYNAYQTYDAEYSLDAKEWTKFGSITMTGAKTAASFSKQLPAEANNQAELYIRMIADKTSAIDGTASANDGNTLAMFFITGTPKLVDDGVAPVLVSTVPENGATGASATGKIVLTFDERVKVAEGATATLAGLTLTPAVSGKTVTFEYKGLEYSTEYTFSLPANSVADLTDNYINEPITIIFTTMVRPTVEKKLYDFIVPDDGTFAEALKAAAARSDQNVRYRIFVKQGDYMIPAGQKGYTDNNGNFYDYPDPRTYFNSPNVSIIGEDPATTSITNEMPNSLVANSDAGGASGANPVEGIRSSGVLYLQSGATDTYFQDIKLWSATADNTGRNVVLVDGGNHTVCKNVTLWAYQDTYVSDNARSLYYFEDGLLRGRTDFLCGSGDVFYNNVTLQMCEAGGYIAVPRDNVKYGYVFKDCTIKGEGSGIDGRYYLGRPWTKGAEVYYIDTKMEVIPYAAGWHDMSADGCTRMAEWNSMTASGSTVDLSGRTHTLGGNPNEPILTAEEALEIGNLHNMFGDWDPTLLTEQAPTPQNVELTGNELTWTGSNYALLYAIVKDGRVVDFTVDSAYTVDDDKAQWAVRAANEMGGLGEAAIADVATGIKSMYNEQRTTNNMVYDLQGRRVDQPRKGLYIVDGKKVVK
ncbi:MAG: Ig-like domain-containing protein [Prevotella sp.]|nr:Ig-like domain-containing protein [Prevotella sp.]